MRVECVMRKQGEDEEEEDGEGNKRWRVKEEGLRDVGLGDGEEMRDEGGAMGIKGCLYR